MRKLKVSFSAILVFSFLLQIAVISASANGFVPILNYNIKGEINIDDDCNVDVKSLEFKVYELDTLNKNEISTTYEHNYAFSKSPDINGAISFERPCEFTYIEVDKESIPDGFGVTNTSVLVKSTEKDFSFKLSKVSDFEYNILNSDIEFYDVNKNKLFVNSNYKITYNDKFKYNLINDKEVTVICDLGIAKLTNKIPTNNLSMLDKINFLYDNNYIDEKEKTSLFIDKLNSKRIASESEITTALYEIAAYRQSHFSTNELAEEITALQNSYIPTFENEATYTRDFFTVHYDPDKVSFNNIYYLAIYLNYAKASLCSTFEFELPNLQPGESTYHVYIDNVARSYSGVTVHINYNPEYTYTCIVLCVVNDVVSNYKYGTAVHEFMHAVQYRYGAYSMMDYYTDMRYYNEAIACNLAFRLVPNRGTGEFVRQFVESPELSLFSSPQSGGYQNRIAGSFLFPLLFEQEYNGFNTIREIYEENRIVNNVYAAIDNVLQDENSSLTEAYTKCMLYNYNPKENYDYFDTDWPSGAKTTSISNVATNYTLPYLATRYFLEEDTTHSTFALTLGSYSDIPKTYLQSVKTTASGETVSHYSIFQPNVTTVFNIAEGEKICMILSNISLDSSINFIVRSF